MENTDKKAIVIGATGLVGKQLVTQLLEHPSFSKVLILSRRSLGIQNSKLDEVIIDFGKLTEYQSQIKGDVLFSCMGTTIKKAKSKENQYKIDFTYQFQTAQIAAKNGVPNYVLVSSTGANSTSRVFYSRIKGELEEAITALPFQKIRILRPSILLGDREEFRFGEKIGMVVMGFFTSIIPPLRKWRGITGSEVARAMIASSLDSNTEKVSVRELDEIFKIK